MLLEVSDDVGKSFVNAEVSYSISSHDTSDSFQINATSSTHHILLETANTNTIISRWYTSFRFPFLFNRIITSFFDLYSALFASIQFSLLFSSKVL